MPARDISGKDDEEETEKEVEEVPSGSSASLKQPPDKLAAAGRVLPEHGHLSGLPGNLPARSITDNLHAGYTTSSDDSIASVRASESIGERGWFTSRACARAHGADYTYAPRGVFTLCRS